MDVRFRGKKGGLPNVQPGLVCSAQPSPCVRARGGNWLALQALVRHVPHWGFWGASPDGLWKLPVLQEHPGRSERRVGHPASEPVSLSLITVCDAMPGAYAHA